MSKLHVSYRCLLNIGLDLVQVKQTQFVCGCSTVYTFSGVGAGEGILF